MGVIIETKELTKKFGEFTANEGISLAVDKGEIRAIIGENGAGKSTLMNMPVSYTHLRDLAVAVGGI